MTAPGANGLDTDSMFIVVQEVAALYDLCDMQVAAGIFPAEGTALTRRQAGEYDRSRGKVYCPLSTFGI